MIGSRKNEIRCRIRRLIDTVNRKAESSAIVERLRPLLPKEGLVLAFRPLPDEPDITPLLDVLEAGNRLLALGNDRATVSYESSDRPIALALVPGRAFDLAGVRLGRGGGAFDRILAGLEAPKIGVAFACQLVEALPREPHDVLMNLLVTSAEIRRFKPE